MIQSYMIHRYRIDTPTYDTLIQTGHVHTGTDNTPQTKYTLRHNTHTVTTYP